MVDVDVGLEERDARDHDAEHEELVALGHVGDVAPFRVVDLVDARRLLAREGRSGGVTVPIGRVGFAVAVVVDTVREEPRNSNRLSDDPIRAVLLPFSHTPAVVVVVFHVAVVVVVDAIAARRRGPRAARVDLEGRVVVSNDAEAHAVVAFVMVVAGSARRAAVRRAAVFTSLRRLRAEARLAPDEAVAGLLVIGWAGGAVFLTVRCASEPVHIGPMIGAVTDQRVGRQNGVVGRLAILRE